LSAVEPTLFPEGQYHHGTALIMLLDGANPKFFAVFTNTDETAGGDVTKQYESTLIRLTMAGTGLLLYDIHIDVGVNTTGIHPFMDGPTQKVLLPAIGGVQNPGISTSPDSVTNGILSVLYVAEAFADDWDEDTLYQIVNGDGDDGDPEEDPGGSKPPSVTREGSYDIHSVAVSDDGRWAYLVTLSYNTAAYLSCWRLYSMNLPAILTHTGSRSISDLVDAHLLAPVDAGFDEPTGYYFEAVVLNAGGAEGRSLWFMIGNRIRVSSLKDYTYVIKEIDAGSGGTLYSPAFNLDCADLIGALLIPPLLAEEEKAPAAPKKKIKAPPNTRLARLRGLANTVKAAAARAARAAAAAREAPPAAEDEDKEGK
jgi:hypothetical protein